MPQKGTSSYLSFRREFHEAEFFTLLFLMGTKLIRKNEGAFYNDIMNMINASGNEDFKNQLNNVTSKDVYTLTDTSNYEQYYGQMSFARMIDNVNSYLKDILKEVVKKRPEIITSSDKTESIEFIMGYDSIEELKVVLVDRKIEGLFYKSIGDITEYFKKRLGIDLFESSDSKQYFEHATKIRNIIVHNRGIINQSFYKEFPDPDFPVGATIKITYEQLSKERGEIANLITRLDDKIATKFDINRFDLYRQQ